MWLLNNLSIQELRICKPDIHTSVSSEDSSGLDLRTCWILQGASGSHDPSVVTSFRRLSRVPELNTPRSFSADSMCWSMCSSNCLLCALISIIFPLLLGPSPVFDIRSWTEWDILSWHTEGRNIFTDSGVSSEKNIFRLTAVNSESNLPTSRHARQVKQPWGGVGEVGGDEYWIGSVITSYGLCCYTVWNLVIFIRSVPKFCWGLIT